MKKQRFILALSIAVFFVIFAACSLGVNQKWNDDAKAIVSINFGGASLDDGAQLKENRALVGGSSFLYLFLVPEGGDVQDTLIFGPYPITKGYFSTRDIPPGTYSQVYIVNSASNVPNAKLKTALEGNEVFQIYDGFLFTQATSIAMLPGHTEGTQANQKPIEIKRGETTTLSGTLIPITTEWFYITESEQKSISLDNTSDLTKQFFGLSLSEASPFSFWAGENVNITKAALYDSYGKNVDLEEKTTENGTKWSVDSYIQYFYYIYVEYTSGEEGNITCSIEKDEEDLGDEDGADEGGTDEPGDEDGADEDGTENQIGDINLDISFNYLEISYNAAEAEDGIYIFSLSEGPYKSYQWYVNGIPVEGANDETFTLKKELGEAYKFAPGQDLVVSVVVIDDDDEVFSAFIEIEKSSPLIF